MIKNPFSVGRWVSGEHFFGRAHLMDMLTEGDERCHWVMGKRRMGKTSLLRQLERNVNQQHEDKFALFWDIQGSYDGAGLFETLCDALDDSQDIYPDKWDKLTFELDENGNAPQILKQLARSLARAGFQLYLLIDETEELLNIAKQDSPLLGKLRRFFQTNRSTTTIIVSSPTLVRLTDLGNTSPFLHGFALAYLGNLSFQETAQLLALGINEAAVIQQIYNLTNGNPFETQLLARHFFECSDMKQVLLELETSPTLNQTLEVNYGLLTPDEQTVLKEIHTGTLPFQDFERAITVKLLRMGYLKEGAPEEHTISSFFQTKWLALHLFDGQSHTRDTNPSELVADFLLTVESPNNVLKQVIAIYKLFLELAQKKMRVERAQGQFNVTSLEGTMTFSSKGLALTEETRDAKSWVLAVSETTDLLAQFLDKQQSWTVFRLHQMVESLEKYTEKDYLDLMILIAEEAALD